MTPLNKQVIRYNLEEAEEEIAVMLERLRRPDEYGEASFHASMQHLYHHLNTAWNARREPPEAVAQASPVQLEAWNRFPTDVKLF